MSWRALRVILSGVFVSLAAAGGFAIHLPHRKHPSTSAQLTVDVGKPGCRVDVDGEAAGQTSARGSVVIDDVEPLEHYVHVTCPEQPETTYFVSPQAGQKLGIDAARAGLPLGVSSLQVAENKMEMRRLLSQAVDLRAEGRFPQAVQALRRAVALDPDNPNLHHELATTFLMTGRWEPARVELLETLRHDGNDADAHTALGFAYEKLGETRLAAAQYHIAVRLDPNDDSYARKYAAAEAMLASTKTRKKKSK
ncbi:MAG: tetratricopeptide repeat protein [Terriglobia bacterium]